MSDEGDGCLDMVRLGLLVLCAAAAIGATMFVEGYDYAHGQFDRCRALLQSDSAAVLRYRTECAKWTLPPREAR